MQGLWVLAAVGGWLRAERIPAIRAALWVQALFGALSWAPGSAGAVHCTTKSIGASSFLTMWGWGRRLPCGAPMGPRLPGTRHGRGRILKTLGWFFSLVI